MIKCCLIVVPLALLTILLAGGCDRKSSEDSRQSPSREESGGAASYAGTWTSKDESLTLTIRNGGFHYRTGTVDMEGATAFETGKLQIGDSDEDGGYMVLTGSDSALLKQEGSDWEVEVFRK